MSLWANHSTSLLLPTLPSLGKEGIRKCKQRVFKVKGMLSHVWRALEGHEEELWRKGGIMKQPQEVDFCLWVLSGRKVGCQCN